MMFLKAAAKRSGGLKMNETMRVIMTAVCGIVIGFFVGASFPRDSLPKFTFPSGLMGNPNNLQSPEDNNPSLAEQLVMNSGHANATGSPTASRAGNNSQIYVPTNPRGAETLAPGIVVAETDLYLRRLWGKPSEDLPFKQRYLVVFTVGFAQKDIVNTAVSKFSGNFTILLFHYDGRISEWDQFEWSKKAIHVSAMRQTKWWYAKRFLHPDVIAPFEYIFIWDEDLGVDHFNAEEYLKLVRKHGLEISQPGLEPRGGLTWQMTRKRDDVEVHKETTEQPGWCRDPHLPPCAGFVEIMAPVFSRKAWRCVWYMIQNDLVHGWGLDLAIGRCAQPANENVGVVDAQWIAHNSVPSLGDQGESQQGRPGWEGVRDRCKSEWAEFQIGWRKLKRNTWKKILIVSAVFGEAHLCISHTSMFHCLHLWLP